MKVFGLIALLLWSGVASAEVRRIDRKYYDPIPGGSGAGSVIARTYQGTPNTLPYGHTTGLDPGLVTHAQTMPSVQKAMDAMARRGYIRRADLDAGVTVQGHSNVVLGYEKPGVPVTERMPVVTVITEPFFVSSALRWVPATQVACGMFEDSAGVLRPVSAPMDSAIVIEGAGGVSPLPPGALEAAIAATRPERSDEDFNYRYTAHDHYFPQDWRETTSPGMQILWSSYRNEMGLTLLTSTTVAVMGGWANPPPSYPYMGFQVGMACWTAHTRFWMHPPDTSGGR